MAKKKAVKKGAKSSKKPPRDSIVVKFNYTWPEDIGDFIPRFDIVFESVNHSEGSYEVRVFINNPEAGIFTPKSQKDGYAGRFVVFGHGGCFGSKGHCDYDALDFDIVNPERSHPVAPIRRVVTVPNGLIENYAKSRSRVKTLTLVPISKSGEHARAESAVDIFQYSDISIRTYI